MRMPPRERALQLMEPQWAVEMARTDINSIVFAKLEDSDTIPVENLARLGAHYFPGNVARNRDNAIECYGIMVFPSRVAVTN